MEVEEVMTLQTIFYVESHFSNRVDVRGCVITLEMRMDALQRRIGNFDDMLQKTRTYEGSISIILVVTCSTTFHELLMPAYWHTVWLNDG